MIRKRKIQANYLKVNGAYEFLGLGFTDLTESPSAKTTSKQYINQSSSTQSVTSYEWKSAFTADQIQSDAAIEHIVNIGEMQLTGSDAEGEYLIVDLDKPGIADGTYRARYFKVAIQVDSFDNNDGELGVSGSYLGISDPVEGTFTVSSGTFAIGFTGKTLEFSYTATGAISTISVTGISYDDVNHKFVGIPTTITSFTFKDGTTTKTATLGSSWTIA